VIREWAKSVPNELNFRTESDNMKRVSRVLAQRAAHVLPTMSDAAHERERNRERDSDDALDIHVTLPVPVEGLVSQKVYIIHTHT
jgi:hypothetical protein